MPHTRQLALAARQMALLASKATDQGLAPNCLCPYPCCAFATQSHTHTCRALLGSAWLLSSPGGMLSWNQACCMMPGMEMRWEGSLTSMRLQFGSGSAGSEGEAQQGQQQRSQVRCAEQARQPGSLGPRVNRTQGFPAGTRTRGSPAPWKHRGLGE